MNEIRMVDLSTQYKKMKSEIDSAIHNVLDSTAFIKGPEVKKFEEELATYLNVKHVIGCANGTDALQIAMMALNLKPGDEVITASFTYVATAEAIALLKLTPVLVDVYPNTFTIDVEAVEKAITPKTKAIVPVHLFGQAADMEPLMNLAKKHNLFIIEDVAQAIGCDYTFSNGKKVKTGTIGDIGCTSFFPSKNLGCYGDGGALFTNDDTLAEKIKMIANHGQSVQYYHDEIGVNSRLDSIQAAILRIKLKQLDAYAEARNHAAAYYDSAFVKHLNITIPARFSKSNHVFHQYTLKIEGASRDELRNYLQSKNIPAMIYYPVPLHMQKAYSNNRYKPGDFPVTEQLCKSVISLPMHTELNEEQLNIITQSVLSFFNK
ncbi:MAG: DegT/DnrJ/EryC1/StrS family aminotransferase [Flavobacteriales bacterium]|nr:DegT/DnrJ/EryC1/StrS family aminotransferase [Flavobacteriales bacterium]